jgi:hypothetical protein
MDEDTIFELYRYKGKPFRIVKKDEKYCNRIVIWYEKYIITGFLPFDKKNLRNVKKFLKYIKRFRTKKEILHDDTIKI